MAVEEAVMVTCDRCKKVEKVAERKEIPTGWIRANIGNDERKPNGHFDLCSLTCVGIWAKERKQFLGGGSEKKNTPQKEIIEELFRESPNTEFTVNEIASFAELTTSGARGILKRLMEAQVVTFVGGSGSKDDPQRYKLYDDDVS